MQKDTTKLNITRQFFSQLAEKLETFFHFAMPEAQFRFFTFEGDDYAEQKLSLLLFNFVPEHVFVTVPQHCNLEKAVEEVKILNPALSFEKVSLDYIDPADLTKNRKTQELKVVYKPMTVDSAGRLLL